MAFCTLEETLQRLNVDAGTTFQASLFRSKTSGKLLFLEAGKDLVDVLLSFLLLPVGTIPMLTAGMKVKPVDIGISCIFESIQNLSVSDLQVAKVHLTRPRAAAISCSCRSSNLPMLSAQKPRPFGDYHRYGNIGCQSLAATSTNTRRGVYGPTLPTEVNLSRRGVWGPTLPTEVDLSRIGVWGTRLPMKLEVNLSTAGFVKANTTFIVTDNLKIMSLTTNKNVNVLSKLNVDSLADLEGNDITVSLTEILQLLHSAMTSNTCLIEVFGKSMVCKFCGIRRLQSQK